MVVLLTWLHVSASSYPDSVLFRDYAYQFKFRENFLHKVMEHRAPTEIVAAFQDMENWAKDKDDVPLHYALMVTRNRIVIERDLPDSLLAVKELNDMLPQLENDRQYELKAEALNWLARYYWLKKKYPQAFETVFMLITSIVNTHQNSFRVSLTYC